MSSWGLIARSLIAARSARNCLIASAVHKHCEALSTLAVYGAMQHLRYSASAPYSGTRGDDRPGKSSDTHNRPVPYASAVLNCLDHCRCNSLLTLLQLPSAALFVTTFCHFCFGVLLFILKLTELYKVQASPLESLLRQPAESSKQDSKALLVAVRSKHW